MRTHVDRKITGTAAAALLAVGVGVGTPLSPLAAELLVAAVLMAAIFVCFDVLGVAVALTGTLPWLVVTSDLLPRLTVTFVAGATAGAILLVAAPKNNRSHASLILRIGIVAFVTPILISLAREGPGPGTTQAAKYAVFPIMAVVLVEATNSRDLVRLRTVALWSSVGAVTVNLMLGLTGVANTKYYGTGEILGIGSEHALALLAGCVTAATLASSISLAWSPAIAASAVATVATGVRSTLPGLVVVAAVRMFSARVRLRVMAIVGLAIAGVFVSGAAHVVEARFRKGQSLGEFSSFSSFGSGRGSIYEAAVRGWWHSSPIDWIFGTGLRTILDIEQKALGQPFVGHSDIIDVGVQLGIVGLIGLLLIWFMVFSQAQSKLPLVVLASFGLINGVLELNGSIVIGMLLATGMHADHVWSSAVERARSLRRATLPTVAPPMSS
jgi:hypothetical protein